MVQVAKLLNLKPHLVCATGNEGALCGDLEVHNVDGIQVVLGAVMSLWPIINVKLFRLGKSFPTST